MRRFNDMPKKAGNKQYMPDWMGMVDNVIYLEDAGDGVSLVNLLKSRVATTGIKGAFRIDDKGFQEINIHKTDYDRVASILLSTDMSSERMLQVLNDELTKLGSERMTEVLDECVKNNLISKDNDTYSLFCREDEV